MNEGRDGRDITRRAMIEKMGKAAAAMAIAPGLLDGAFGFGTAAAPLQAVAGPDRITILPGKTYINAWAGYGFAPWDPRRYYERRRHPQEPEPTGPEPTVSWRKQSGPGTVTFEHPRAPVTAASFSAPGTYVLEMVADNGDEKKTTTFHVDARPNDVPAQALLPVWNHGFRVDDPIWSRQVRNLIVNWLPWCVHQLNDPNLKVGPGGIDNFIEAGRALRGEPHGKHKGYVFSNSYVHNAIEAMSYALMIDPAGEQEIADAQNSFRVTLEEWIPIVLAAREPDGYLQTAYTLRDRSRWAMRWTDQGRGNHEGYTQGYFIEAGIAHHIMTKGEDTRLFDAAVRCADCWVDHIGPPPKQRWFDGHQEMEQALVRLGRYVNQLKGGTAGQKYFDLAKFLLDCRGPEGDAHGSDYDQSRLPVTQAYEAVGHAVRAVYTYSGMADVAAATHDVDYLSAVNSIWDSVVNRKYYVTGGVGSGETSEGFGAEYSLPNHAYCESCSSCGEIHFQARMNRLYHDAKYFDLVEETLYNALLGATDLDVTHYYYDNPLAANVPRYQWHTCPCCSGNVPRTLLMLPTWMYGADDRGLFVNLFIGSTATVERVAGTDVEITQKTQYPWQGTVAITLNPAQAKAFTVRIRIPNRAVSALYTATPAVQGFTSLTVNGTPVTPKIANGYAELTRPWAPGDTIALELPLAVQVVRADERIEANRGRVALRYGPLVYDIERVDQDIDKTLDPHKPLTTEWRPDLLGGVTVIHGTFTDGSPMLAIPNFSRYNREVQETYSPERPPRPADGSRPKPFPPRSHVWMASA
jgi:uncharacterized protein